MKTALFIVGENIKYNTILVDYIQRAIKERLQALDTFYLLEGSDKNLFLSLEEAISKNNNLIIATDEKNFNIIGKILSTIHNDSLVLKQEMLLPSKSSVYDENTYMIETKNNKINVLRIKENQKLPAILLNKQNNIKFINVFDIDEESCQILLSPIAENFEIKIKIIKIIEGWNLIKIESLKYGQINNFIESAKQLLNKKIIAKEDVVSYITYKLIKNNKKITVAESCTGGLLSSMFIRNSGVSNIINGNLVTYANEIKEAWLGVSAETLEDYGAVSEQCVKEMLEGAINVSNSDIALAISGIAGPDGGTKEKPVGTIYIGAKNKDNGQIIERLYLKGDRVYIQNQAVLYAIKLLLNLEKKIFF
jgi:nicotinamide-nucleotide amidase